MLTDFTIAGIRGVDGLQIPRLRRVNLVTGKNATGKTRLLEALRLYADAGAWETVAQTLHERQEARPGREFAEAVRTLVTAPLIGGLRTATLVAGGRVCGLGLGWVRRTQDGLAVWAGDDVRPPDAAQGFVASVDNVATQITVFGPSGVVSGGAPPEPLLARRYLPLAGIGTTQREELWASVELTDAETQVLRALRALLPDLERIGVAQTEPIGGRRYFRAKLHGIAGPVPLATLGDGLARFLDLLLACRAAAGGLLLVDEIDTGLHYTVLPRMWELLSTWAQELDVQVVATTHSLDCVRAFPEAARRRDQQGAPLGQVVRLERTGSSIRAHLFEDIALAMVERDDLEVR